MKNTEFAKTLTASLPHDAQTLFAWIADPDNLSRWHGSFCRSILKENGSYVVESPRGSVQVRFIHDDHALVLDILAEVTVGLELTHALRVLRSGEGSELVWTLVKPDGVTDSVFHEQVRWAGNALHHLRKASLTPAPARPSEAAPMAGQPESTMTDSAIAAPADSGEPLQAPSIAEVSQMPLSGKKLFIGNLSYDWTDVELRAHFAEQGTVTNAEVARFRGRGGRSRGFGFVEMGSESEAQGAIEKLHGSLGGGRQIIVRLAKSQESRPAASAPEATVPSEASALETEIPAAPVNVIPHVRRPPQERHRMERPPMRGSSRRGGSRTPRPTNRNGNSGGGYREVDITNKSGYEIFPRRAAGAPAPTRAPESAPTRSRSNLEASPYMEDTGDIENHGRRPPSRRRRS